MTPGEIMRTLLLASWDSSPTAQAQADYVCAEDEVLNDVIERLWKDEP